ncbi:MAG: type VI secretion system tip protein VgrG [Archangium sp.]|nr:type VI secretion system tip protein VgrG [Archangium sp.]
MATYTDAALAAMSSQALINLQLEADDALSDRIQAELDKRSGRKDPISPEVMAKIEQSVMKTDAAGLNQKPLELQTGTSAAPNLGNLPTQPPEGNLGGGNLGEVLGTAGVAVGVAGLVSNLTGNAELGKALTIAGAAVTVGTTVANLLTTPKPPAPPEVPTVPAGSAPGSAPGTPAAVTAGSAAGATGTASAGNGTTPVTGTTSESRTADDPYEQSSEEEGEEDDDKPLDRVNCSFAWQKADLPKCTVFELELAEELSKPYLMRLRVTGPEPDVDESLMVGEACTLTMVRGSQRYINGIVSEASFSSFGHDVAAEGNMPMAVLHLTIVPALALLGQRRENRIFQNVSVPDILNQVLTTGLSDYGRAVSLDLQKEYPVVEYCTQYDETDLAFVQRLMAQEGIVSIFVQGETAEELKLIDDVSSYTPISTYGSKPVPLRTSASQFHSIEVVERFLTDTRLTPTSASTRVFNWTNANPPTDHKVESKDAHDLSREQSVGEAPASLHDFSGTQYGADNGANQAKLIQETALSRGKTGRGTGIVTGMTVGGTFELENAIRSNLNRGYVLTKVVHRGRAAAGAAYLGVVGRKVPPLCEECPTEDKCKKAEKCVSGYEISYSNSFECVHDDVLYRPERPPRRFVQTAQTAVVVGVDGEEITTDEHGRIKVQFHWDRLGTNNEESSCWVRVAQMSAGVGFGGVFIPRHGMEVVVTFLEGNPDKPLVTGCVYNGINVPPVELPATKTRSAIRTWSSPSSGGYNELAFEDAAGSEEVYLQAQKDLNILVKNDKEETVQGHESRQVTMTRTLKVGLADTVAVGAAQTIAVGLERTVAVGGFHQVVVGLQQTTMVAMNDTLTVGKNRTESVTGDSSENVGATKSVTVGKDHSVSVTGEETITVGGNRKEEVTGNVEYVVGKKTKENYRDGQHVMIDVLKGENGSDPIFDQEVNKNGIITTLIKGNATVDIVEGNHEFIIEKGDSTEAITKGNKQIEVAEGMVTIVTKKNAIVIDASKDKQLQLVCGDSSIILKKDGIVIKGKKITLDGDNVVIKGKTGVN